MSPFVSIHITKMRPNGGRMANLAHHECMKSQFELMIFKRLPHFSRPVVLCQRADKYNLQMLKKSRVASKHDHTCIRLLSSERLSDSTVR